MPSPALITTASIQFLVASKCGAPDDPCLITTASAPIDCKVCAVSLRLSPFETLDPFAEKLITSALNLFEAASKEILVLVLSSKNKLTTVLPRKVGNFFTGRSEITANSFAVSRTKTASSLVRS